MRNPCNENDVNGFSSNGECCCNCQYQRPINAHPWNKDPFAQGRITEIIGYGCTCPEFFPDITFSDREHSLCECWTERTWDIILAKEEEERNKRVVWNIISKK